MKYIVFIALMWAGMAQAQTVTVSSTNRPVTIGTITTVLVVDTIPVWIVYLDSVRLFSAYPEYDIRLEVAPGWKVNLPWRADYFDQDGRRFNPDNIILDRPRKPVRNPFKE